jgi:uncharacterized membrane protein (DUF106 family)
MNKKVNTALFILGATLANIVIMILFFLLFLYLIATFVDPESPLLPVWIGLMFLCSIGGSFLVYTLVMKKIMSKVDLESKLHPIFRSKGSRGKPRQGD